MPLFYALVDATTGRESEVELGLKAQPRILGSARCKERNHDFLIKFDAVDFTKVDEFLQTEVRRIPGVAGVEIIVRWEDHSQVARDAKSTLD